MITTTEEIANKICNKPSCALYKARTHIHVLWIINEINYIKNLLWLFVNLIKSINKSISQSHKNIDELCTHQTATPTDCTKNNGMRSSCTIKYSWIYRALKRSEWSNMYVACLVGYNRFVGYITTIGWITLKPVFIRALT